MFKKNPMTQYIVASFIFGVVFGCWLSMNFYGDLNFMGAQDVYEHDSQYQEEIEKIKAEYEKREEAEE